LIVELHGAQLGPKAPVVKREALFVCTAAFFNLVLRVNAVNVRDTPFSASQLEDVQQQVMWPQSVVVLRDGLNDVKVAACFSTNALNGGDQHSVLVQKTKSHVEQRLALAVFQRQSPKTFVKTDAVEFKVNGKTRTLAEPDALTLNQLLGCRRAKDDFSDAQVGCALNKALLL
jgi:hypothetical protein